MIIFQLVSKKPVSDDDSNFWLTILQDSISGITIGITIAIIGYIIWKKQNLYSKKFEVYINVISSVNEIYSVVTHNIMFKDSPMLYKFYEFDNTLLSDLRKNKLLFISFFGQQYNEKIEYFININKNLEKVEIKVTQGKTTISKLYTPEEYTPEIVNYHKQSVINKMNDYKKELELVSKDLKNYALIKNYLKN